jgi:hypothetical protein
MTPHINKEKKTNRMFICVKYHIYLRFMYQFIILIIQRAAEFCFFHSTKKSYFVRLMVRRLLVKSILKGAFLLFNAKIS